MDSMRLGSKENLGTEWGGVREERELPQRYAGATPTGSPAQVSGSRTRDWRRIALRFIRDAAVGIAVLAMIPIATVALVGDMRWSNYDNSRARIVEVNRLRPLAITRDASISPVQAGAALNALGGRPGSVTFPVVKVSPPVLPWNTLTVTSEMFLTARPGSWRGPYSDKIIKAVPAGFSPAELRFLRVVAEAPVWKDFDLVARAPAVDLIGGAFQLPFRADAFVAEMPIQRFASTKELAYAAVSRAAYYLAIGERGHAEEVLKTVVGFGFSMIDNGTTAIDGLIGRVIVGIGRGGLAQFYAVTGNANGAALAAEAKLPKDAGALRGDALRQQLLRVAVDPAEPRPLRYQVLYSLAIQPCTNVRDLLFGTRASVSDAFVQAKKDLARYPSERALIDLISQQLNHVPQRAGPGSFTDQFFVGASTFAGAVLQNPRMAACTRLLLGASY
jgi:hypothetical protein